MRDVERTPARQGPRPHARANPHPRTSPASGPRSRAADGGGRHPRLPPGQAQGREAALRALEFFSGFEPRLVGPVLEGTADAHSAVALHAHCDDPDALPRWLEEHGIPAQSRSRHLRLDRNREGDFPVWLFSAEDLSIDVTVLPLDVVRQAPLSGIDEKPMRRASLSQLRTLLAEEEIAAYETG